MHVGVLKFLTLSLMFGILGILGFTRVSFFGCTFTSLCLPQEEIGFDMKILDIGGGFGGSETQLELVSITLLLRTHGAVEPLEAVPVVTCKHGHNVTA